LDLKILDIFYDHFVCSVFVALFYDNLVHFVVICKIFPILVSYIKNNLATPLPCTLQQLATIATP
jgi:hypothetical protein